MSIIGRICVQGCVCFMLITAFMNSTAKAQDSSIRDVIWFLRRLRTVDHLLELENSHTAMSSTWDRAGGNDDPRGGNSDGQDFKCIEDGKNILLDVDGPGCIHRLGRWRVDTPGRERFRELEKDTRIQIIIDHSEKPLIDLKLPEFFTMNNNEGPFPYPLVSRKTLIISFFPIPYEEHCRIQLVSPHYHEDKNNFDIMKYRWSLFWEITYTTYPLEIPVKSLSLPFTQDETWEIEKTCKAWLDAESSPPQEPAHWQVSQNCALAAGQAKEFRVDGMGVIRQMRLTILPAKADILRNVRLQIFWDDAVEPSVDAPVGYFFGHADTLTDFHSLLLGVTGKQAYCQFPMPFAKGAIIRLENRSDESIGELQLLLDIEKHDILPSNWGRFHATWTEERAATEAVPKFGPQNIPCKVYLERHGRGKYVGALLHVNWSRRPDECWWGEGDVIIWSDEDGWPPSYHGTGCETYFNGGNSDFDRRANSGFVSKHPDPTVYAFHLNDAFQFQKYIRVVGEEMGYAEGDRIIQRDHPIWATTAYWYAPTALPAQSKNSLLKRPG